MSDADVELVATAPDHELTITYGGRTWHLMAYALEDFGTWEAIVRERGTEGPALPAAELGVTQPLHSPWQALAAVTEAVVRRATSRAIDWDDVQLMDDDNGMFDGPVEEDGDGTA